MESVPRPPVAVPFAGGRHPVAKTAGRSAERTAVLTALWLALRKTLCKAEAFARALPAKLTPPWSRAYG